MRTKKVFACTHTHSRGGDHPSLSIPNPATPNCILVLLMLPSSHNTLVSPPPKHHNLIFNGEVAPVCGAECSSVSGQGDRAEEDGAVMLGA